MIDFVQVGNKIAEYRKKNHLSQEDLAEKVFVTRQALSKWENGTSVPSIDSLMDLCQIFCISFEEILCINQPKQLIVNPDNIFEGHERNYIIEQIINQNISLNVCDILYQMSPNERISILRAIKDGKLSIDLEELTPKLTNSEKKYLLGGCENYAIEKSHY